MSPAEIRSKLAEVKGEQGSPSAGTLTPGQVRAALAARSRANQPPQLSVGGYTAYSPEEAADIEAIQSTRGNDTTSFIRSAVMPSVSLGMAGGLAGAVVGKSPAASRYGAALGTGIGTSIENAILPSGAGLFSAENAKDTAINVGLSLTSDKLADKAIDVAGPAFRKGLKRGLKKLGFDFDKAVIGTLEDSALDVHDFGIEMARAASEDVAAMSDAGLTPSMARRAQSGGIFTAPELTESQFLDQLQGIFQGSVFAKGFFRRMDVTKAKVFDAYSLAYRRAIGPYFDDAGKLGKLLSGKVDEFSNKSRAIESTIHKKVDKLVGDAPVELGMASDNLGEELALWRKIKSKAPDPEGMDRMMAWVDGLSGVTDDIIDPATGEVLANGKNISWRELKQIRSRVGTEWRRQQKALHDQASKVGGTLYENLSKIMKEKLDELGDAAVDSQGRTATQLWERGNAKSVQRRKFAEQAQFDAIADLINDGNHGAGVVGALAPKMANAGDMRLLRRLFGGKDSKAWKSLQRWKVEGLMNGTSVEKALSLITEVQPNGPGPAAWKELLGDNYGNLVKFYKAAVFAGAKAPVGTRVGTHLLEFGLAVNLGKNAVAGDAPGVIRSIGATAGWVIGTRQVAEWLTSPDTAKMVLGLVRNPVNPPRLVTKAFTRALGQAIAEGSLGQDQIIPIPATANRGEMGEIHRKLRGSQP